MVLEKCEFECQICRPCSECDAKKHHHNTECEKCKVCIELESIEKQRKENV